MKPPEYERDGDWYVHTYPVESGSVFRIQARGMRRERTGIHATLAITYNGQPLGWTNCNIERNEERTRLANSVHQEIPEVDAELFSKSFLTQALGAFCFGLWGAGVGEQSGELMEGDPDIGPPKVILGGMIVEDGSAIIFAPPGRGKSFTAMAMAVSQDAGVSRIWACEQRRTGYVNLERSASSMRYRLARVNRALGLDPKRPLPFLNARGRSLMDVLDGVRALIKKHDLQVIWLDSISRAGAGKLVEDSVANSIIDSLNSLGITWAALGHSPRNDESHLFGSMHFDAGADVQVQLLSQLAKDGMTLGIGLKVTKGNDVATGRLTIHALDFDKDGLVAIRSADGREFPEITAGRKMSLTDEVADYLLATPGGRDSATSIASEIERPRQNVATVLNSNRFVRLGPDPSHPRRILYGIKDGHAE